MSVDPNSETVVSLLEAAKSLPARRRGKKPHVSCLYRWTTSGCRGVILESIQVRGTRCTSREALARFFRRLTHDNSPSPEVRRSRLQVREDVPRFSTRAGYVVFGERHSCRPEATPDEPLGAAVSE
jgi:hypothetical protein